MAYSPVSSVPGTVGVESSLSPTVDVAAVVAGGVVSTSSIKLIKKDNS